MMEVSASEGVALGAIAKGAEALASGGLLLSVQLENHLSKFLVTLGHGQVNSRVSRIAVVVQRGEAALAEVKQLFSVHFFLINYLLLLFIKTSLELISS